MHRPPKHPPNRHDTTWPASQPSHVAQPAQPRQAGPAQPAEPGQPSHLSQPSQPSSASPAHSRASLDQTAWFDPASHIPFMPAVFWGSPNHQGPRPTRLPKRSQPKCICSDCGAEPGVEGYTNRQPDLMHQKFYAPDFVLITTGSESQNSLVYKTSGV